MLKLCSTNSIAKKVKMTRDKGWKVMLSDWAFEQGIPTVLLVGILGGMWVGMPKYVQSMNTSNEQRTTQVVKAFVDDQERDQAESKRADEVNSDLIQELLHRTGLNVSNGKVVTDDD
jgi:hypothetical protein